MRRPALLAESRFSLLNRNDDGAKSLDRPDAGDNRDISVWETRGHGDVQLIQSGCGQPSPQNSSVGPPIMTVTGVAVGYAPKNTWPAGGVGLVGPKPVA